MTKASIRVRVIVNSPDAQDESILTKLIGAELLRLGFTDVSVIADSEHLSYIDNEVEDVTDQMCRMFYSDPRTPIGTHVVGFGHPKSE